SRATRGSERGERACGRAGAHAIPRRSHGLVAGTGRGADAVVRAGSIGAGPGGCGDGICSVVSGSWWETIGTERGGCMGGGMSIEMWRADDDNIGVRSALQSKVFDELRSEIGLDSADLHVDVEDRVVTLSG